MILNKEALRQLKRFGVLFTGLLFCVVFSLSAQINTSISGHIYDKKTKLGIPSATIKVIGTRRYTLSDFIGNFKFENLLSAVIQLEISCAGYKTDTLSIDLQKKKQQVVSIFLAEYADSLKGITIYSSYLSDGSEKKILQLQKTSVPIVDLVSEEAIERTSDQTIADVSRRINGLSTTTENAGQPVRTIIRGIDPKYNYTLINGFKIPSPADKVRYVPLSFFPADMVQRVEVFKNLTPDMEGDAIGGVVNLVLRNATDKPIMKVNLQTGYQAFFFNQPFLAYDWHEIQKKSPYEMYGANYYAQNSDFTKNNLSFSDSHPGLNTIGNLIWGKRFFHKKLGILLSTDYQNIKTGNTNFFIAQNSEPQLENNPGLTNYYLNRYSSNTIRETVHAMIDYKIKTDHTISLYQLYTDEKNIEARNRTDTSLTQGRSLPGTGSIKISNRSRLHIQKLYSTGLLWNARLSKNLSLSLPAVYSIATGLYPDWAELSARTSRIESPNGEIIQGPLLLEPLTRIWLGNQEKDLSISPHIDFRKKIAKKEMGLSLGGLYHYKNRDNFYTEYLFQPAITSAQGQPFTDIYHAVWTNNNSPQNPLGNTANPNTYTAKEYISAGYFSFQLKIKKLDIVAGLRYESTKQTFISSVNPSINYGKEGSIRYHDFLPSIQLKHQLTSNSAIKASWYKSISRPALYDITFYSLAYEDYAEAGNPFLQRAKAGNGDLRFELHGKSMDELLIGSFFKQIQNPYEKTLLSNGDLLYPLPQQGLNYTPANVLTSQVRNAENALIYGLEFSGTKYFGKIGLQASYTFTYSRIEQATKLKMRENPSNPASNIITITKNEIRPLQGQSPHLANLGILYKHPGSGLTARVSAIYTGKRIYSSSGWYGLDYWQRGYWIMDAYIDKKIAKTCKLYIKASNLFNTLTAVDLLKTNPSFATANIPSQESSSRITVMRQTEWTNYYLGIQWAF